MLMPDQPMILVATDDGLAIVDGERLIRPDALAGHAVGALAGGMDGRWWALLDHRELWQSPNGLDWSAVAKAQRRKATCLGPVAGGLLVGTARAHLMRLDGGALAPIPAFDAAEGRSEWYTPWGAPADVRSISAAADGTVYVNVHVGGVLRSADGETAWQPTLDIEHDVHQVLAVHAPVDAVLVAAFDGFGRSDDGGQTWRWHNEGLHAHYCRAIAVAGETLLISASSGHHGRRAAVYRRPLDASGPFERCHVGLPEWFSDNVDTGCLAARGHLAVIGSDDGSVFLSGDTGQTWTTVAKGLAAVRAVALG